jgi:hypothetical protein
VTTEYAVPDAQLWHSEDVARIDPAAPKHRPRLAWMPGTRAPLIVSPDGTRAAVVTTRYGKRSTLSLGVVDLRHHTVKSVRVVLDANGTTADGMAAAREWRPITLDDDGRFAVLGMTGMNAYVVRLTIDLGHDNALAVQQIHYPEDSLAAGSVSTQE